MYKSSILFERTQEEKDDINKSWIRSDQAFFAAGACHILAAAFMKLHSDENFKMIYIKPKINLLGNHVYVSNGTWAFDHNGWIEEKELLAEFTSSYRERLTNWDYDLIVINNFQDFCINNNHRLPNQFTELPWDRATNYIKGFKKPKLK